MRKQILSGSDWTLSGWNRHQWHYEKTMELGNASVPVISPIPATVPGSVQTDLLKAGKIRDWNYGTNFRSIEWIEHREWVYTKSFVSEKRADRVLLHLDGLDFCGYIFLNGKEVYHFDKMMLSHTVDITDAIIYEALNELKIVFLQPPEVDGQVGYTSKINVLKSRYNYGWDWMPRLVNIGIFRDVWIEYADRISVTKYFPNTELKGETGYLDAMVHIIAFEDQKLSATLALKKDGEVLATSSCYFFVLKGEREAVFMLSLDGVEPWNPNGFGEQPLYDTELIIFDENGNELAKSCAKTGFRTLSYTAPDNAPKGCLTYNPVINGRMIPLRGVNWVPLSPFYGSVTKEQYIFYLKRFKNMGCNLIRVWGGALQESECFYSLCDEMGLLVWQEFPQSSSGLDNAPNEDKEYLAELKATAYEFVRRARNHICLTFWCGGNELYLGEQLFPCDLTSENLKLLSGVVERHNPDILFLPTSPSHLENGVKFRKDLTDWVNGDAHGSWTYDGVDKHYDMIYDSPSLLFSEVGTPACSRPEKLVKYCTECDVWPPDFSNPYWTDRGAWWVQYAQLKELFGDFEGFCEDRLSKYAAAFRFIQYESLRASVGAVRRFGGSKSGIIFWMASEPFPNAANNSLLESDGYAKPAYYAVKKGFSSLTAGLRYKTPYVKDGRVSAEVFVCSDDKKAIGALTLKAYDKSGCERDILSAEDFEVCGTLELGAVDFEISGITMLRLSIDGRCFDEWIFTCGSTPFGELLSADNAELSVEREDASSFIITNNGESIAYFAELDGVEANGTPVTFDCGYFCLLPGESRRVVSTQNVATLKAVPMNF